MLTTDELERYNRQMMIKGFGREGQEKLKQTKVIIAGGGGLGSPSSIYLAAAGVGMIRIVDHDRVELSNLNRQVLHWDEDVGRRKVASAAGKLKKLNPEVEIEAIEEQHRTMMRTIKTNPFLNKDFLNIYFPPIFVYNLSFYKFSLKYIIYYVS